MSLKTDKYILAEIDFKLKVSPYTVTTFYFSDRWAPAGALYTSSPEYIPCLISVDGLGAEMGEVLPKNKTGSIVLSNARGTVRYDLSVGDLLSTHSLVDQPITVKTFEKRVDNIGDAADLVTEFSGFCSDVSISHISERISINIYDSYGGTEILNTIVDLSQYPTADDRSLGRALPVVFGEGVQTLGYKIVTGGSSYRYGYASTIGGTFVNNGVNKVLAKDKQKNIYGEVQSVGTISSSPFVSGLGLAISGNASTAYSQIPLSLLNNDKKAQVISSTSGVIVSGIRFYGISYNPTSLVNTNDNPATNPAFGESTWTFEIYGKMPGKRTPGEMLANVTVEMTDFVLNSTQTILGGESRSIWNVDAPFNVAVPLLAGYEYFIVFTSNLDRSATRHVNRIDNTAVTIDTWNYSFDSATDEMFPPFKYRFDLDTTHFQLFGVEINDEPTPTSWDSITNRGASAIQLKVDTGRNQLTETLDSLEFIVEIDGLKDSAGGIVTGTNNKMLTTAEDISKFLNYLGDTGKSITTNTFTFSDTTVIGGAFTDIVSIREALSEILFNARSSLIPRRDGTLSYYRYKAKKAHPYYIINESECSLIDLEIGDKSTIINAASIMYNKLAVPLTTEDLQQGSKNYGSSLSVSRSASSLWPSLLIDSYNIYGTRSLGEGTFLDFINLEEQALLFAEAIFRQYALENWHITFYLPYWGKNYRQIDNGDIVRFQHQKNLHAAGTDSPITAQAPLPGIAFNFGQVWLRAKSYDLRTISRSVEYTGAGEPVLRFKAKVLNNPNEIY